MARKQGFTCENPVSAKRDSEPSKPHEAVWLFQCKKKVSRAHRAEDGRKS